MMRKIDKSELENIDIHPGKLKRFLRKAYWFFGVYLKKRHDATVLTRNGLLTFDSKDKTTGRILHVHRNHEFSDMMTIVDVLREKGFLEKECSGIVVDVGGYIGMSSTAFLLENIFEKALAFEPSPLNYRLLKKNVASNQLDGRLLPFNVALSNATGELKFELSEKNYGDHRVRSTAEQNKGHYGEEGRDVISVAACKFDDFLLNHQEIEPAEIKLIWMDVQGHEAKLIEGAREFFKKYNVPVVMEFWPYAINRSGISRERFIELVSGIFKKFDSIEQGVFKEYDISEIGHYFDKHMDPEGGSTVMLHSSH